MQKVRPAFYRTDLYLLVFISLSCGFHLFALFNGRRFVELFLTQVADYTVARAFSFKTP